MSTNGHDAADEINEHVRLSRAAFGEVLRMELGRIGMSKRAFSAKSGMAIGTIVNFTKDRQTPRLPELDQIAEALGVDVGVLFSRIVSTRERMAREESSPSEGSGSSE